MSEARQLALLLAAVVALAGVGVLAGSLFGDECGQLEQLGELELAFTDAADALPVEPAAGAAIEAVGEQLGIGPWRGAVALPDDLELVSRSEFGFFVVTEDAFTVLRPGLGIASAARGREGLEVFPAGLALGLRADDGTAGVLDGEYELERCGRLDVDGELLTADRGFALARSTDGERTELVAATFSGEQRWRVPAWGGVAAHIVGNGVLASTPDGIQLRALEDGTLAEEVGGLGPAGATPWLWADEDGVLLRGVSSLVPLSVPPERPQADTAGQLVEEDAVSLPSSGVGLSPVVDAARTPAGIVALRVDLVDGEEAAVLATDRSEAAVPLPAGVNGTALLASAEGHVGIVVRVDDRSALLVYGPDQPVD